jgi:hypothetical protein
MSLRDKRDRLTLPVNWLAWLTPRPNGSLAVPIRFPRRENLKNTPTTIADAHGNEPLGRRMRARRAQLTGTCTLHHRATIDGAVLFSNGAYEGPARRAEHKRRVCVIQFKHRRGRITSPLYHPLDSESRLHSLYGGFCVTRETSLYNSQWTVHLSRSAFPQAIPDRGGLYLPRPCRPI